jgi:glycogen synthase
MTADCVGGVWTYALELIRALDIHGIRVVLTTFGRKLSPAQAREAAALGNAEICESAFKLEWMEDPWDDIDRASDWLLELQEKFRPDIVHLNHYAHGNLSWNSPVLIVGHSCVLSWWRAVRGDALPDSWNRYAQVVGESLRMADMVVAPSHFMLAQLQDLYGPLRTTAVIANGRSIPHIAPVRKEPFIFASGRLWDRAKNVQVLCDVAPELPWPVYVAGETASDVCLNDVVRLGHLSSAEMLPYFSRASIYALPARYEPFGLSVVEAALAGCALVLGDILSLRQIWDGAALFVPPKDPDALRDSIRQLVADEPLRNELAAAARRTAACYTPARLGANYVNLYRNMVSEPAEVLCAS